MIMLITDYFFTLDKNSNYHRHLDTNIFKFLNSKKNLIEFVNTSRFENKNFLLKKPHEDPYIISVGYINKLKNQLEQLKLIKDLNSKIKLFIIYNYVDNKYFNKLKKYILENDLKNVFFYNTKDVDLCELISNSEFIINTSKSEILPLTLIEANSLKKTYLSYNVGSIYKIDGGIINESYKQMLHNANLLLENKILKMKMEEIAFQNFNKNFSLVNLEKKFQKFTIDRNL